MIRKIWLISALLAPTMLHADTLTASWYGDHEEGRLTASGCVFRAAGYSAASRTLPFGTVLLVEHNGRSVLVVVDDRGPFIRGRSLDLSLGAADALGMRQAGVARVQTQVVGHAEARCLKPRRPRPATPGAGGLVVTSR
jgi:rare lipoprotein A